MRKLSRRGVRLCAIVGALVLVSSAFPGAVFAAPVVATFGPPTMYGLTSNASAFDLASGDFTGTKIKDIVVATGAGGAVDLLAGNGDGTFAPATAVYAAGGQSVTAIATGDFNADGHLDIAIVTESVNVQNVVILLGDGRRHFTVSAIAPLQFLNLSAPSAGGVRSIAVGTFSTAGTLDVAVTESVNDVSVFPGDGHGRLGARIDLLAAAFPESLVVGNIYGRGRADVAVVDNDSASVYSFAANGNETFAPRVRTALGSLPINAVPLSLSGNDLRRLGRFDLFALYSATGYPTCCSLGKILLNNGNGSFAPPASVAFSGDGSSLPRVATLADFNADTAVDIAAVLYRVDQSSIVVLPGNGDGTFSQASQTTVALASGSNYLLPSRVIADDFNNDGRADIAVAFSGTSGLGVDVVLNASSLQAHGARVRRTK